MNVKRILFMSGVLVLLFWLSTQSIVGSKLLELQVYIEKDEVQNFELASQLLERQFRKLISRKNSNTKVKTEVEEYVLSSSVLNHVESDVLNVSLGNHFGLVLVNSVRFLSFKPLLNLWKERELLVLLKYAFYLERNRQFSRAVSEYDLFIKNSPNKKNSSIAFALLHQIYCNALLGNTAQSLKMASSVIENFPGTHYATTATGLKRIIALRRSQTAQIQKNYQKPVSRAKVLYETNDFFAAKKVYEKLPRLTVPIEIFRYARVKEEIGDRKDAIKDYQRIVENGGASDVAKMANRRLLLIGNLYGGGKRVKEYANRKAAQLGDVVLADTIKQVSIRLPESAVARESLHIQKIKEEIKEKEEKNNEDDIERISNKAIEENKTQDFFDKIASGVNSFTSAIGIATPVLSDPEVANLGKKKIEKDRSVIGNKAEQKDTFESLPENEDNLKNIASKDDNDSKLFLLPSDAEEIHSGNVKLISVKAKPKNTGLIYSLKKTVGSVLVGSPVPALAGNKEKDSDASLSEIKNQEKLNEKSEEPEQAIKTGESDSQGKAINSTTALDNLEKGTQKDKSGGLFNRVLKIMDVVSDIAEDVLTDGPAPQESSSDKNTSDASDAEASNAGKDLGKEGKNFSESFFDIAKKRLGIRTKSDGASDLRTQKTGETISASAQKVLGNNDGLQNTSFPRRNKLLRLDETKRNEIDIQKKIQPVTYLLVIIQKGTGIDQKNGQIWGQEMKYVAGYIRIRSKTGAFLVSPKRLVGLSAVSLLPESGLGPKGILFTVIYSDEDDKEAKEVLQAFSVSQDGTGFVYQRQNKGQDVEKIIPFGRIKDIRPIVL